MVFRYDDYSYFCLRQPILLFVFLSLIFIFSAVVSIKQIITKSISADKAKMFLLPLFTGIFLIRMEAGILLNGGIYLFKENETDSITVEGTVEEITPYDQFSFYSLPNISKYHHEYGTDRPSNVIHGCKIVVDNTILKAPEKGTLSPGDRVSVTFLPKSGYILAINKIADEITAEHGGTVNAKE